MLKIKDLGDIMLFQNPLTIRVLNIIRSKNKILEEIQIVPIVGLNVEKTLSGSHIVCSFHEYTPQETIKGKAYDIARQLQSNYCLGINTVIEYDATYPFGLQVEIIEEVFAVVCWHVNILERGYADAKL